jgi:hypothetical protein
MGLMVLLAICLHSKGANTGTSYMGGFGGFFSSGSGSSYQLQKIAYTYRCLQCSRANLKRYCKIPFSVNQKNGNNRESKPNHPAHKLVSFLLTA